MTPSKPSTRKIGMTCVIDISLLQFGQLSIVGTAEDARLVLMTLPFARQNVRASKRLTLDWVPVSLKSNSWNWLGRFATAARSPRLLCAYYPQESSKKETGYNTSRMPCCAAAAQRHPFPDLRAQACACIAQREMGRRGDRMIARREFIML